MILQVGVFVAQNHKMVMIHDVLVDSRLKDMQIGAFSDFQLKEPGYTIVKLYGEKRVR